TVRRSPAGHVGGLLLSDAFDLDAPLSGGVFFVKMPGRSGPQGTDRQGMPLMMRLFVLVFGLLFSAAAFAPAHAEYPDKPGRGIGPVAAGGGVDVMARLLAQKLSERFGQQFVVENRPGAAGIIGSKAVIASPADGTTLLYTPSSLSLTVAVN